MHEMRYGLGLIKNALTTVQNKLFLQHYYMSWISLLLKKETPWLYSNANRQTKSKKTSNFLPPPSNFHLLELHKNQEILPPRAAPFRRFNNESVIEKTEIEVATIHLKKMSEDPQICHPFLRFERSWSRK